MEQLAKKEIINIQGEDVPYAININKRLKYMRISVGINGIRVSIPRKIDKHTIESFLRTKEKWIYKHYMNFEAMRNESCTREWRSGEKILYKGIEYNLIVGEIEKEGIRVSFDGSEFKILVERGLTEKDRVSTIESALKKLYIKMARQSINERLVYYSEIIGVKYNEVRIKEQKTRWGSCSHKGNLNFNWRIVMAPQWVMDYVIVHELCHLKYLNHSKQYWSMVESYMPRYKEARQWLKENGRALSFR